MTTNPMTFLQSIAGFTATQGNGGSADRPIKLARIDPSFDQDSFPTVLPRVTFEGESTLSGKFYAVASPYWPQPNDRVWMVPIGSTYMIVGSREAGNGGVYIGGQIHIPGVRRRIATNRLESDSAQVTDETVMQSVQAQVLAGKWYEVCWHTEVGTTNTGSDTFIASVRSNNISGAFLRRKREVTGTTSSLYQIHLAQEWQAESDHLHTFVGTLQRGDPVYRNATGNQASIMYVDYVRE